MSNIMWNKLKLIKVFGTYLQEKHFLKSLNPSIKMQAFYTVKDNKEYKYNELIESCELYTLNDENIEDSF